MKKIMLSLIIILPTLVFAHEGHDKTPGSLKSLHGGVVQAGKEMNLEVIISGHEINLFPTSHEGLDIPSKDVKISAMAKPKKGATTPIKLVNEKGGFSSTVDLKGANRLPVEVTVTTNGKTDHFTIQVEE
jgi:hypothetical protein